MTRAQGMQFPSAALLLAIFLALVSSGAQAGVGERAGEAAPASKGWPAFQRTQYYSFDNQNYCWYNDGWQGPGWIGAGTSRTLEPDGAALTAGTAGAVVIGSAATAPTALAFGVPGRRITFGAQALL